MIAPFNFDAKADANANQELGDQLSVSHNPTEPTPASSIGDIPTAPYDVCNDGPVTFFRYYLDDVVPTPPSGGSAYHTPRRYQIARSGLIGASVLASAAFGAMAWQSLKEDRPNTATKPPATPTQNQLDAKQKNALKPTPTTSLSAPERLPIRPSAKPQTAKPRRSTVPQKQSTGAKPSSLARVTPPVSSPALPLRGSTAAPSSLSVIAPTPLQRSQMSSAPPSPTAVERSTGPTPTVSPTPEAVTTPPFLPQSATNVAPPEVISSAPITSQIGPAPAAAAPTQPTVRYEPLPTTGTGSVSSAPTVRYEPANQPRPTRQTAQAMTMPVASPNLIAPAPKVSLQPSDRLLEANPMGRDELLTRSELASGSPTAAAASTAATTATVPANEAQTSLMSLLPAANQTDGITVRIMPLTQQEAVKVASMPQVGPFTVMQLEEMAYAAEWLKSEGGSVGPAPTFGFVDYQRQVIAVPQRQVTVLPPKS